MSQTQTPAPIAAKQAREHAPEIIFIDELDDRRARGQIVIVEARASKSKHSIRS